MWPYKQPATSQPAVLTLPSGAKAIGAITALSPVGSATWVGFEASIGRAAHARQNLKEVQNVHGLNSQDAKNAEKDRIAQNNRDLNRCSRNTGSTKRRPRLGHAKEELRAAYTSLYNNIRVAWGAAPAVWAKIVGFGKISKCWDFYPRT
eukprot:COSAG01_NODE_1190_length_11321_cov_15.842809_10_plen_149_part_00